MFDQLITAW
ncbi:Protein of unknown function [Thermobacillus xylanilyticus]|uniref:Uncharacterized protein n=1 Tax=Thermobacillus xylanilyticus TaxID=76633 RepID=A0ABM8V7F7_THEXY|nr:Protein of unknown function [Thermobacillus xylanilyticus]